MSPLSLEQKLAQYDEFFAIEHDFSVNIMAIDNTEDCNFDNFVSNMPMPFKLATDMNSIDQSALRSLQGLGNSASQLVGFLNQQSKKIDLLIGYILSQQDELQHRYQGVKFGGGGIKFIAPKAFNAGQLLELKIFLLESHCAIYCYGEVIEVESANETFTHKVTFHFIREEDRETLVRNSLHEQSKQLQKLAKLRNQENEQ
ncbi:PilZ domain-containing protein [Colwellia psychrerythraea]|uniref:Type IV pilus assembly PilZ n=1 Tax=Colwellia psychrerythraea TaxID=28229 RepID=A0A099KTC6_COLPS|nr:PilZ domain-containing protein [Colwellia psychrerythraea]KGJ92928.1 type IV pilus assembly PilZ [Colwellia psychrerythraea]